MTLHRKLNVHELMQLARDSRAITRDCACAIENYREWTRIPADFPEQQLNIVGTLADDPYVEATYAEHHPAGTHYWSPDAPLALRHFPCNRCSVQQCGLCGRACLRYVEAGGYYVEPRVRALDPELIVDPPVV